MKWSLLIAACAACVGVARADATEYLMSFAGHRGPVASASIYFTASDTVNRLGGYDITSVRGSVGTDAITGLIGNTTPGYTTTSQNGAFSYDNVLFGTGPLVDNGGILFTTASGFTYNLWAGGGLPLEYDLERAVPQRRGGFVSVHTYGDLTTLTPPPVPHIAAPTVPTVLDFEDSRTHLPDVTQSHGFQFLSDGHCCNYVVERGPTERATFTLYDLVMSAMDGSAFDVSSLDLGPDSYANLTTNYAMLLTGTKAHGRNITTTLNVLGGMQTYQLTGFDDLLSLRIAHPTHGAIYMGLDNVAVSPSAAVPEPASWALMLIGFGTVGAAVRRRRRIAATA